MLRSLIIPLLCMATAAGAVAADNLLPWADFKPAEKTLPESWKFASAKLFEIREDAGAAVVRATAQEGALVIASYEMPVPAGIRRLSLTGRIRTEGLMAGTASSQVARVALQLFTGTRRTDDQVHTVGGNSDWKPFRLNVAVTPTVDRLQVHFGSLKAKSGTVDVADLALTAMP